MDSFDCVFTCLEPSEFDKVYGRYSSVPRLVSNVPGYVPDSLREKARLFTVPDSERPVDVGYRGRPLPGLPRAGRPGARDRRPLRRARARGSGLRLDLAMREGIGCTAKTGIGSWPAVVACSAWSRASRASISRTRCSTSMSELSKTRERVSVDDLTTLPRWEDVVFYRTISPRHFEAAAVRVCQILFEGRYSEAMEPMVHYIPLKKDFSNLDEVLERTRSGGAPRAHRERVPRSDRVGGLELPAADGRCGRSPR